MVHWFFSLGPWAWIIMGLLLLGLELLAPGQIFLWLGVSAIVVGLIEFLTDLPWQGELIIFGVLSLVSVIAYRKYASGRTEASDRPFLNRRTSGLVGREFSLHQAIDHGEGKIRVNDTLWRVRGPDLPQGTRVKVVDVDGALLIVEATDTQ
ncbi:MAG: NfeD family protein [Rhodobiaceae bacterium]|nr:NfeD family protein [Rhodobiaceae bacterium]MCC0013184.1 NfeD family protein [Rhodobiaceae bacterium]